MKIGNIDLGDRPVLLAPMEDVTDASFRIVCKKYGADMVYTEFIPSDGLIRDAAKAIAKGRYNNYKRLSQQQWCQDPELPTIENLNDK